MVNSMTGYGRKVVQHGTEQIIIEIRTVNHRFLDTSVHMPHALLYLENKVKQIIMHYFARGSIDVYIHYITQSEMKKTLEVDWHLMDQYVEQINEARSRYKIKEDLPLSALFQLPDLFTIEEKSLDVEDWESAILSGIHETAKIVLGMRQSEGKNLQADILNQIDAVKDTVQLLRTNRNGAIQDYMQRIQDRVKQYVDDFSMFEEGRLQQEIALLAEKGDITEELIRIDSHIDHFTENIHSQGQIGRTLDFVTQELHREINTIASKSQDVKMNQRIISMKRNIEKIKEQIQNIE